MKFLMLLLLSFNFFFVSSQVDSEWVAKYEAPTAVGSHHAVKVKIDDEGNIYVIGISLGDSTSYDFLLVKYTPGGSEEWVSRFDGGINAYDAPYGVDVDYAGNVFVTGRSRGSDSNYDFATVKYDKHGNQQWVRRYDDPVKYIDVPADLVIDLKGNIYVTGESSGQDSIQDMLTIKYNTDGDTIWTRRFRYIDSIFCEVREIEVDAENNIYIGGRGDRGYLVIKYNENGDLIQTSEYKRNNAYGRMNDMKVDTRQNVYVTGLYTGKYNTVKFNAAGIVEWAARYNSPDSNFNEAYALDLDTYGNVYITGVSDGDPSSSVARDMVTIKYDSLGVEKWVKRNDGINHEDDFARALIVGTDNTIYVTGERDNEYYTIAYSTTGSILWEKTYDLSGDSKCDAVDVVVDCHGNSFVTGHCTYGTGPSYDPDEITTIKYKKITPLQCVVGTDENIDSNIKVYPNPTIGFLYVEGIRHNSTFQLFDITGRKVFSSSLQPGTNTIEIPDLSSGIFIYTFTGDSKVGKLIVE